MRIHGALVACACIASLFVSVSSVSAAEADAPERVRYDGRQVVRVQLDSVRDLRTMTALAEDVWSHGVPRVGVAADFMLDADAMGALATTDLAYEILIPDVQARLDAELDRLTQPGAGAAGANFYADFRTYEEINARLDLLATTRPDLVETFTIGQSIEGRDIRGVRITGTGGDPDKPGVLFNGCQHAREWVAVMTPMYIAETLVNSYDSDPLLQQLMDQVEFYVVPIVNPDGYVYSWDVDRLWRKNRRFNGDGSMGVDLNRNWGFEWGGPGSDGNPDSITYRGTAPFSEPESLALRNFIAANENIVAHNDFHAYSQLHLYPWGFTDEDPPDIDLFEMAGDGMEDASAINGETYVAGTIGQILYLASGNAADWSYGAEGVFAFTTELRDTGQFGFILPPEQIIPCADENFSASVWLTQWATQGLGFTFPNGLPELLDVNAPTPVTFTVTEISAGPVDATSAAGFVRVDGGDYELVPASALNADTFEITLPAAPCGAVVEFFFEVATMDGEVFRSPFNAPDMVYAAESFEIETYFADDFELENGWTVGSPVDDATSGIWERVDPNGTSAQPEDDNPAGVGTLCFITGNGPPGGGAGVNDVDDGITTLTSPALNGADADAVVSYYRWYSNNQGAAPGQDSMLVQITGDGGTTWTLLEEVDENANAWVPATFRIGDFVEVSGHVRLRFIARDLNAGSLVEAGVDDVTVDTVGCSNTGPDLDGDGDVDAADLAALLAAWGPCDGCPADLDDDGVVGASDLAALLASWTG